MAALPSRRKLPRLSQARAVCGWRKTGILAAKGRAARGPRGYPCSNPRPPAVPVMRFRAMPAAAPIAQNLTCPGSAVPRPFCRRVSIDVDLYGARAIRTGGLSFLACEDEADPRCACACFRAALGDGFLRESPVNGPRPRSPGASAPPNFAGPSRIEKRVRTNPPGGLFPPANNA